MKLAALLEQTATEEIVGPLDRPIGQLRYDSRQVEANDVFFAWKGEQTDGLRYLPEVLARGAAAVVLDRAGAGPLRGPTLIRVSNARRALATMAASFYGNPGRALDLVGITGTNGKTTTSFILKHLLGDRPAPVGLIGTVGYEIGPERRPAARTTPESLDLQSLLAQMRDAGCREAVLEVSSHALEQGRVEPLEFRVGIFTNLTQDHLDYHGTMEEYFAAKRLLFSNLDRAFRPGTAVLNLDDPHGRELANRLSDRVKLITYSGEGRAPATLRAEGMKFGPQGTQGHLIFAEKSYFFESPLLGSFNVANLLAAVGGALALGRPIETILERLRRTPQIPGRLETFLSPAGATAVVDYAHTDDAVAKTLAVLRSLQPARLIVVLGCGGNRDKTKRPRMARAALAGADYTILTSDNPRDEDPEAILEEMERGIPDAIPRRQFERIVDRREAILTALRMARPGDLVCVAGKGHETTQEIAGVLHPFDDRRVVGEFLKAGSR